MNILNRISKMKGFVIFALCMLTLVPGMTEQGLACTDFLLSNSCYVISGRTMDFSIDLKAAIFVVPKRQKYQSTLPDGTRGLSWVSKYGFVGIQSMGLIYSDGLNSQGLSCAILNLDESIYPEPAKKPGHNFLMLVEVVPWVMGNFATVKEARDALSKIQVFQSCVTRSYGGFFHFSIHDAKGDSLVVEFIDGEMKVYDNNNFKVLTNSPPFDWHKNNLRNYVNLTNMALNPAYLGQKSLGYGTGMHGLPGDASSPSRFLQAFFLNHFISHSSTQQEAVANVIHILNLVQVANGEALKESYDQIQMDKTQWSAIRDHTNRVLYFRDNQNSTLRAIDLKALDFKGKKLCMPLATNKDWNINVNGWLKKPEPNKCLEKQK